MLIELRIAVCAAMLVTAAIIDVRKREIPDKIWIGFGAFGALLAAIDFAGLGNGLAGNSADGPSNQTALFGYLLGIGLITPIGYAIYKTGLFGGADSKALIAIPVILPPLSGIVPFQIHGFTALTALTNALIISMSQLVVNAGRNLVAVAKGMPIFEGIEEGTARKALAFAMGYKTNNAQGYLFPMEGIDESGKRRFAFNPSHYDEFVDEKEDNQGSAKNNGMWVTQALPFIVYIAIGFVITIVVGDLLALVFQKLLF